MKCIFWEDKACAGELERTMSRISSTDLKANLTTSYTQIMNVATVPDFKLYVTGYGRFFNEHADWCSDLNLFPHKIPFWYRAKLTRELRQKCNDMTVKLNERIEEIVNDLNMQYVRAGSAKRIIFVDTDPVYENYRWCDGMKRDTWRDDTYFFNIKSNDYKGDGTLVAQPNTGPIVIDIGGIDIRTCMDDADAADDDGLMLRCVIARQWADSGNDVAQLNVPFPPEEGSASRDTLTVINSGKFTPTPASTDAYAKAFHPKTYPLAKIASRIYQQWLTGHSPGLINQPGSPGSPPF
ncbi:hypothetical protein B0H63DRAFT_488208 [Podospora didyma]|uniref:Uncharacterized protein n=1 Tax=Podospora didyma TaxID=330526 RepID=A0AAE0K281_9PEZI|nr:hypothetical protein B0H63DRAFT_488208 [Podospora didyma]